MPVYRYDAIAARGYKRGPCEVCGKTAERSRIFEQTLNPFNRDPDGCVKTSAQIRAEVNAEALAWQRGPVRHARCEAVTR